MSKAVSAVSEGGTATGAAVVTVLWSRDERQREELISWWRAKVDCSEWLRDKRWSMSTEIL
jgi:hypothetical protein